MAVRIGEATRYQVGEMWDRFYGAVDEGGKFKLSFPLNFSDNVLIEQ